MFNSEQQEHMRDLAQLAEQGKLCACGWESKRNCEAYCLNHAKRDEALRKSQGER